MQHKWDIIREIIRVDLITMKGGKNNNRTVAVFSMLFFLAVGYFVSPLGGLYMPFLLGAFFVPTLFHNEIKYHSEKLWSLLPIARRDLVNARFLLAFGLYTGVSAVFWLLMLLSLRLHLWELLFEADGVDDSTPTDIVGLMADRLGFTPLGFFNLCFFGAFAFGMIAMSGMLRKYFKDSDAFSAYFGKTGGMRKGTRTELIAAGVILGILALWVLIVTGILPVGKLAAMLMLLFANLAKAANGFLMGATFLAIALFHTVYQYVCTVVEYEQKDL